MDTMWDEDEWDSPGLGLRSGSYGTSMGANAIGDEIGDDWCERPSPNKRGRDDTYSGPREGIDQAMNEPRSENERLRNQVDTLLKRLDQMCMLMHASPGSPMHAEAPDQRETPVQPLTRLLYLTHTDLSPHLWCITQSLSGRQANGGRSAERETCAGGAVYNTQTPAQFKSTVSEWALQTAAALAHAYNTDLEVLRNQIMQMRLAGAMATDLAVYALCVFLQLPVVADAIHTGLHAHCRAPLPHHAPLM
eukprot:3126293-Amphidinium_carterae.1